MSLLETKKLSINFGGLWAVKDVDFALEQGEVVGLIGPNGSGKTTFLNVISGIYRAGGGRILLNGEDITGLKPYRIYRKGISRTYQSSRLCWDLSVADNLLLCFSATQDSGFWQSLIHPDQSNTAIMRDLDRAMELLSFFNPQLPQQKYLPAKSIPQIDRRRIEITRALVSCPKVLLLDEPTAGLNDEETMIMMRDIGKIKQQMSDIAIIIIEHDMQVMRRVPQRIVVFNAGEKIAEGSYEQIIGDQKVINAYLGGTVV